MARGIYNEVVRSQINISIPRMKWLNWDCCRLGWLIEYIRTVVCASGDYLCQIISSHNSSIQRWIDLSSGPFICAIMYIYQWITSDVIGSENIMNESGSLDFHQCIGVITLVSHLFRKHCWFLQRLSHPTDHSRCLPSCDSSIWTRKIYFFSEHDF